MAVGSRPMSTDNWEAELLREISTCVLDGKTLLHKHITNTEGVHLAIFNEPYLQYMLEGKKTLESRFSVNKCAPYMKVESGDILLLKRASGPIVAVCIIDYVWFYEIDKGDIDQIKHDFMDELCAHDNSFWQSRKTANFATLLRVSDVITIDPISCAKRDRRGWVVLNNKGASEPSLEDE